MTHRDRCANVRTNDRLSDGIRFSSVQKQIKLREGELSKQDSKDEEGRGRDVCH